jgi:hypothetical protein
MLLTRGLLVGHEPEGGAGLGRTQQGKPRCPILRKVADGIRLVHFAVQEPFGAGEAPALKTATGEVEARLTERIQEIGVRGHIDPKGPLRGHDLHRAGLGHRDAYGL